MKKAQLLEQPFIYIFAIVVIGFILIFGFMMVKKVTKLESDVEISTFFIQMEKQIDKYYNLDKGSRGVIELITPPGIAYACFVNKDADYSKIAKKSNEIRTLVEAGSDKNLFLIYSEDNKQYKASAIKNIKLKDNPVCLSVANGKVKFKLENIGAFVQVSGA